MNQLNYMEINMKQYQIVNAYNATEKLSNVQEFSENDQWAIYTLRKALRPHVEFQSEREEAIKSKYVEFADETGCIHGEHFEQYLKDIKELGDLDIELSFIKPKLSVVKGVDFKTIEALEDFIEFIPVE